MGTNVKTVEGPAEFVEPEVVVVSLSEMIDSIDNFVRYYRQLLEKCVDGDVVLVGIHNRKTLLLIPSNQDCGGATIELPVGFKDHIDNIMCVLEFSEVQLYEVAGELDVHFV